MLRSRILTLKARYYAWLLAFWGSLTVPLAFPMALASPGEAAGATSFSLLLVVAIVLMNIPEGYSAETIIHTAASLATFIFITIALMLKGSTWFGWWPSSPASRLLAIASIGVVTALLARAPQFLTD